MQIGAFTAPAVLFDLRTLAGAWKRAHSRLFVSRLYTNRHHLSIFVTVIKNEIAAASHHHHPTRMFSSGSESDAPTRPEREFVRGRSALSSAMGDMFESSAGSANPVMSPVMASSPSSVLEESILLGLITDGALLDARYPERAMPVGGEYGSPLEHPRHHDNEAPRSSVGVNRIKGGGTGGGYGSGLSKWFENDRDGGAHHSAGEYGNEYCGHQQVSSGLPPPAAGFEVLGVPNGRLGGGSSGISSVSSYGSGGNNSGCASPCFVQRRGGPPLLSESTEPKDGRGGGKRPQVPIITHRLPVGGSRGAAAPGAGEDTLANGGEGIDQYSGRVSQSPSDFTSGVDQATSECGAAAAAPSAAAAHQGVADAVSATALSVVEVFARAPPAQAPPAPEPPAPPVQAQAAPIDFANNDLSAEELLSQFDSNTTWAGASAYSVATTRTGVGSISSALSVRPGSYRSTTGDKLAAVWSQQPQTRNGSGVTGVHVTSTANNSSRRGRAGRASQPERAPGGTPARRGVRNKTNRTDTNLTTTASGMPSEGGAGESPSKPRALARPTTTSRKGAMSPHGLAMDAAMRMVEEQGARLGIVREEKEDAAVAAAAAAATAGGGGIHGDQEDAYANQIAAPAMTSLEQRRQRAKAWAKSRCVLCQI